MKIAIITPYSWVHPGGVNNHIKGFSGWLQDAGHQVTVVSPDGAEKVGGMSTFSTFGGDCEVFSAGRSFPIPANGSIAHIALIPGVGRRVKRFLTDGKFDVVHVHEPLVPIVSTSVLGITGSKLVGTFHAASEGRDFIYKAARWRYGKDFERMNCRIAVSSTAEKVISDYFPNEYEIIPNGVDISRFNKFIGAAKKPEWKDEQLILFVGRDEPRKGLQVLLDAFSSVIERVPGCRLLLAGSSIHKEKIYSKLPPDLREKITVLGFVSDEELTLYYTMADVFCAPALGGESFGIILLEAMAAGTPVVASDIDGYKELIDSTGGGLMFKTGDRENLSNVLVELLQDKALQKTLSKQGLNGVKRYSWERVAMEIVLCYER